MNFAVFLMGENFLLGQPPILQGFFITKGIEAPNEELAASAAIAAVRADPRFAGAQSEPAVPAPTIRVEVVHALPHLMRDTDYTFFPMEDE